MKKIMNSLLVIATLIMVPLASFSQNNSSIESSWLEKYYKIKDALVNSNATGAANAAEEFSASLKMLTGKKTDATQTSTTNALQQKILAEAAIIAGSKDLVKQRAAFQSLSESVITKVKTQRQLKPAYIMYCPMKKAYWISPVDQIKNPYYGSSMLTCGNISETLQ